MEKFSLSTFQLKVIAIISMFIDHTGAIFFPREMWLRLVGRLAFPIFAFLLVEGFVHTKDVKKYGLRLLLFAFVSEIIFDFAFFGVPFFWGHQNIFFTLFLGLVLMGAWQYFAGKLYFQIPIAFLCIFLGDLLSTDYGSFGVALVAMIFFLREFHPLWRLALGAIFFVLRGGIMAFGALGMIPLALYKGRQGPKMKYFFYIFYPGHLLLLILIREMIR